MTKKTTDIRLGTSAECSDGPCGKTTNVILNPVTKKVSHIVVENKKFPQNSTRLVPIDKVNYTTKTQTILRCSIGDVMNMPSFTFKDYIAEPAYKEKYYYFPYSYSTDNYVFDDTIYHTIDCTNIPAGELMLSIGMKIEATDGNVGKLDVLVLNSKTGKITHLLMKEGHLWGKKEVAIPAAAAFSTVGSAIYLKINKKAVGELPTVPLKK